MRYNVLLFQLIDTTFPVGGFVYSMGTESAIKSHLIKDKDDLYLYLKAFTQQIFSFEMPYFDETYNIWQTPTKWKNLFEDYAAMLMNPYIEKSSLALGKNWVFIIKKIFSHNKDMQYFLEYINKKTYPLHFIIIFGLICKGLKITPKDGRSMLVYTTLRDQISVLTRLGIVGPMGGQQLLSSLLDDASSRLSKYSSISHCEAYKSAYLMEIAQLNHNKIHAKLFQN